MLEGTDEFGSAHRSELAIDKDLERVSAGEIGFSVEDGKTIMAHLQQVVVNQQCEAYVLTSRFCMDCKRCRRIKDYGKRKIRTVFGCVEVGNPRIMNCQCCLPHFCDAWTVLRDICPDQATPELMERSARVGSLLPYRKAAEVIAEFLSGRFGCRRGLSQGGCSGVGCLQRGRRQQIRDEQGWQQNLIHGDLLGLGFALVPHAGHGAASDDLRIRTP